MKREGGEVAAGCLCMSSAHPLVHLVHETQLDTITATCRCQDDHLLECLAQKGAKSSASRAEADVYMQVYVCKCCCPLRPSSCKL